MTTAELTGTEEANMTDSRLEASRASCLAHEEQMGWPREYPDNPMVDEDFKMRLPLKRAVRRFRSLKPYRVSPEEFLVLVDVFYGDLADIYNIPHPEVVHEGEWEGSSGGSSYNSGTHTVTLRGKKSLITTLHEFAHARGYGETGAVWWSVNLFKTLWPKSFDQLEAEGHFMSVPGEEEEQDCSVAKVVLTGPNGHTITREERREYIRQVLQRRRPRG